MHEDSAQGLVYLLHMCIKQKALLLEETLEAENLVYSRFSFSLASEQHEQQVLTEPRVKEKTFT